MEKTLRILLKILLWFKGFKLNIVSTKEEENQVIDFAHNILFEEGCYPEDYLNLLPKYYPNSVAFVVYHKNKMIGSLRLIKPNGPNRISDFWNVKFPTDVNSSECREMGTLVIDKKYRGKSRLPITALLDIAYNYSNKNGIKWWFASAYYEKFEKFKLMNPSCRIMEVLEPNESQLKNRTIYNEFFNGSKSAVIFIFNLEAASYAHQFKRILKQKFNKNTVNQ